MERTTLGEFEELVLLTIAAFNNKAYGVLIKEEIEKRTERKVSMGAMYTSLGRLENKNLITSEWGDSVPERGGKRKRLFSITAAGKEALLEVKRVRDSLYSMSINLISAKNKG